MIFTWIGGPTFLLELGAFVLLGDPVFGAGGEGFTRRAPLPELDVDNLCAVILSRAAPDHLDSAATNRLDKALRVVAPGSAVDRLVAAGCTSIESIDWWETTVLEREGESLSVTAVPANAPYRDAAGAHAAVGNGYYLEHNADGRRFTAYWTGDCVWSDEVREIQRRVGHVDLLVVHLGAELGPEGRAVSCGAKDAMQFVFRMQPRTVIPIHHTTFSHYAEPLDAFKQRIDVTLYEKKLTVLVEGQSFEKRAERAV